MPSFLIVIFAVILFFRTGFTAEEKIDQDVKLAWRDYSGNTFFSAIVLLRDQANIQELDQKLHDIRASRAHRHQVIVETLRAAAEASQEDFLRYLDDEKAVGRVRGYTPYWIVNCIVLEAQKNVLMEIAGRSDIERIEPNVSITLIGSPDHPRARTRESLDLNHGVPAGIRAIRAPEVWYEYGITGAGRLVGNFDSGVDGNHPALASRWRGITAPAAHCWRDNALGTPFPTDNNSHGTHVMGTMCGNSEVSNDSIGVAPEAQWIACRFTEEPGPAFDNTALAAFQWFVDPDGIPATIEDVPDVVQNSWGVGSGMPGYSDCYPLFNNVIMNCEAASVVVVFSAGNEGPNAQTLRSPATYEIDSVTVFSVGAVDATNNPTPPYPIANFSSRGPGSCPPYSGTKPEVCAPGVDVYSSAPGGNYVFMNGTSMAGPHVAGIVALLRQAVPNAEPREIKSVLMRSAIDYGLTGEDNTYGFGFVDAYAAVQMLLADQGFIFGIVRNSATNQPISGVAVQCTETSRHTLTRSNGEYRMAVPGDSAIHLRFSGFGYFPQVLPSFVVTGDTVIQNVSLNAVPTGTLCIFVKAGLSTPMDGVRILLPQTTLFPLWTDSTGSAVIQLPGDSSYVVEASYQDAALDTLISVPANQVTILTIRLESERSSACGPDSYGYRSFDRYDTAYAPGFDWMEIAPSAGGSGTVVSLQARDSSAFICLPFPFSYYGQTYDSLTANENGWLAAGISHDHSYFNSRIPNLAGPSAMMAPFWDNLHDGNAGEICYAYDTLRDRFIVEYSNLQYYPGDARRVTFQVQIFSPTARPTPGNDNELLFLYKRIDNISQAVIGIENPAESAGLQLFRNGVYHPHTWLITAGTAIRFSTRASVSYGRIAGQIIPHPQVEDLSSAVVRVGGKTVPVTVSGDYAADSLLTGWQEPTLFLAGYERIKSRVLISGDSQVTANLEAWRLDPPTDFSGTLSGSIVQLNWRPPECLQQVTHLDEFRSYNIYRNNLRIASTTDSFYYDSLTLGGTYDYYAAASYAGGSSDSSNHATVIVLHESDVPIADLPSDYDLRPCWPNPFNSTTRIEFSVPSTSAMTLEVFNLNGRRLAVLADGIFRAGRHHIIWDCRDCASGLYWIVMSGPGFHELSKAILLK